MTSRLQEIKDWLISLFPTIDLSKLNYMQSDASSRNYLRIVANDNSYIIMDTKPGAELDNFINIAGLLATHKINVPKIIHCNAPQGLVLLSDLGNTTYLEGLRHSDSTVCERLYLDAIATLIKIQPIKANLIEMNELYINNRLEVFKTWYLQTHLELIIDSKIIGLMQKMQHLFTSAFLELPSVFVHVDYHCRNLMLTPLDNPGVLDFQDAMRGPATYDLVSLFQDAYISWPRAQVESWVDTYRKLAMSAGILPAISQSALLRNFDIVGLQRHIKNLGIFARLHHRDKKSNYLNDMPMLLSYITTTCNRYPELNWLLDFIEEVVPV